MTDGSQFSPAVWDILRTAKACALADSAPEISPQHLFQACLLKVPDLAQASLASIGLKPDQSADYLRRAAPAGALPDPTAGKKRLSVSGNEVVSRAEQLAGEHPEVGSPLVEPMHLWVSVCGVVSEFGGWLLQSGWAEQHIHDIAAAAQHQLPPRQELARLPLKERELELLNRFCHRNLTGLARAGRLTPAYGVETVREQITRCLLKRDKRSVVVTGAAGVGKTKLVEDLAVRIANGEVPELAGCQLFELDIAQFTRGTHLAGSRAERWAQLAEVLRAHSNEVILFIDELHTIVGLPIEGQAMDLANMLKPLLVDDKVRIIGATTGDEYRRYIDGDPALARRFTEVKVPEPDRNTMLRLLRDLAPKYEEHHHVEYSPEALEAIYDLAQSYFPNQSFPAKGVDLVDEVGVHVRTKPREARDAAGEAPPFVRPEDVRETLRRVWGIEPETILIDVAALIKERVIGQDHAADRLDDVIVTSALRYGAKRPAGPRATILFLGPPGVGKSYMAEVLSDILFPGRNTMLTLDMTEFSGGHAGEHARWRLLGPPPPYVGWENGGILTSHALQNPVSVVLVDEFDKADTEARNVLLRVLNDGWAQDGRGRVVSFKGIYFIITANAARELWERVGRKIGFLLDNGTPARRGADYSDEEIREVLAKEGFAPELLSRLSHIVVFNKLGDADLERIATLKLRELRDSALTEDMVLVEYDEEAMPSWLVAHANPQGDVRGLRTAFERHIETPIARWRWQTQGRDQPVILRLDSEGDRIGLAVETAGDRIEQLLYTRVASVFADRQERARRVRTAGARLGN